MAKSRPPAAFSASSQEAREREAARREFFARLEGPVLAEELFDALPDVVFFIKDVAGRYMAVNRTLVQRLGAASKDALLGKTADEVFPLPLGGRYREQDREVSGRGRPLLDRLELHLYPDGSEGWCLTHKVPLYARGRVVGLVGISRDVAPSTVAGGDEARLAELIEYVQGHLDQPLRVPELAARAGLSVYQLGERLARLVGLSPGQFVAKARIDAACHLLRSSRENIAAIALACGYTDQSALTRAFKKHVGLSPKRYREAQGRS